MREPGPVHRPVRGFERASRVAEAAERLAQLPPHGRSLTWRLDATQRVSGLFQLRDARGRVAGRDQGRAESGECSGALQAMLLVQALQR